MTTVSCQAVIPQFNSRRPELYGFQEAEKFSYANRLKANAVLEREIGAKVTRHAKSVTFQLAEVAATRTLFADILDRISRLAIPPPLVT